MFKKSPFFIAEISANHNGSLKNAKKLINQAKRYGANAVKLQTYLPDLITIKSKNKYFKIKDGLWKNYYLWDLYNKGKTPFEWHRELFKYAKKVGITLFSTPFDEKSLKLLEDLNCPFYKVASFEMTHLPLIKKIASTKKHMIISTGMANLKEIKLTYETAIKYGAKGVTLLYCVSNYPSKIVDFNLRNIEILKKKFDCQVGLSDHSKDNIISTLSLSLGANVFEKHIALKGTNSLDAEFSLKGKEILEYRKNLDQSFNLIKSHKFKRSKDELKNKKLRCSIFSQQDIKKGERFSKDNIRIVRPGHGLEPKYFEKIIGKKCKINLKKNLPILKKYI
tara:strand:- start:905 stop:1912 length:1008 start_codon:yes stop_codon:yes gene_type:complete